MELEMKLHQRTVPEQLTPLWCLLRSLLQHWSLSSPQQAKDTLSNFTTSFPWQVQGDWFLAFALPFGITLDHKGRLLPDNVLHHLWQLIVSLWHKHGQEAKDHTMLPIHLHNRRCSNAAQEFEQFLHLFGTLKKRRSEVSKWHDHWHVHNYFPKEFLWNNESLLCP